MFFKGGRSYEPAPVLKVMDIYILLIYSSYFDDCLCRVHDVYCHHHLAERHKQLIEEQAEKNANAMLPEFTNGDDEELDQYLFVKDKREQGEKFIKCEILTKSIKRE